MTIRTRTLSMIAAVALALGTAVGTASAQPPAGRGPGRGFGPGGPLPMLRQLNLTDDQRAQIKALTDELRKQEQPSPARRLGDLHRELQAAVLSDTPDAQQIEQLRASIGEAESSALVARVDLELKIAQILTPEQRKQARDLMNQRGGGQETGR